MPAPQQLTPRKTQCALFTVAPYVEEQVPPGTHPPNRTLQVRPAGHAQPMTTNKSTLAHY